MADNNFEPQAAAAGSSCFKEAVCIDAERIYDSCSDKDCLEDLRVYFTDCGQSVIDNAFSVKTKQAEVLTVFVDVEPVPFNRGFYSVDITYFFKIKAEALTSPVSAPTRVNGLATFSKKVILFGSEGNAKVFTSTDFDGEDENDNTNRRHLPKATVKVAEPIVLSANLRDVCHMPCDDGILAVPSRISKHFEGDFSRVSPHKVLEVTLGVFSIVQLERNVPLLIPVYDFCIPDKECNANTDNPCDLFKRIKFPVDEFFPPRLTDIDGDDDNGGYNCGCY